MRRDPTDRHAPERNAVSFLASLLTHALIALLLFSVATSSSEQTAESVSGGVIMTVSTRSVPSTAPAPAPKVAPPVPHATVVPKPRPAAQPRSAPPHPRVLHDLSKFSPKAPPNPTPVPESSLAPNPVPTQAVIAVSPAPVPLTVPTSLPVSIAAASIKAPPTAAPVPKPSAAPTQVPHTPEPQRTASPTAAPATPVPEPTAIAVAAAPIASMATPLPVFTPGAVSNVKIPAPPQQHGTAATPGPKPVASPGPRGIAPVKNVALPRPVQALPATPPPAPVRVRGGKRRSTLNERLQSLIPTAGPSFTPAPATATYHVGGIMPTPLPEPTPPPDVIAATKFLYVEDVGGQRWKQSILGTAPEERYVKMYVTSVKRIGFITWCTGWAIRMPITDYAHRHWIIEPHESFICSGHLEPFNGAAAAPTSAP